MQLAMRTPSGWGNYWPLLRLLHLLAAALGRRLVLSSEIHKSDKGTLQEAVRLLPSKQFAVGGHVPWLLGKPEAAEQLSQSVVLDETVLLSGLPPLFATLNRRAADALVRPVMVKALSSFAHVQHLWLNLSTWRFQQSLAAGEHRANPPYYMPDCPRGGSPHQLALAACIERLVTMPRAGSQLAERHGET